MTKSRAAETMSGKSANSGESAPAFTGMSLRFPPPGGPAFALPDIAADGGAGPEAGSGAAHRGPRRFLAEGCYVLTFDPAAAGHSPAATPYVGTLRVERVDSAKTIASGDLYLRRSVAAAPTSAPAALGDVDLAAGIPMFPRNGYRLYLRVTKILLGTTQLDHFTLGFELHRFTPATNSWANDGAFAAVMQWQGRPPGFPGDLLKGELKNASGVVVGTLSMAWVSKYLRRATIEIDRVSGCELPLDNGAGMDWQHVFDLVGWQLKLVESDSDVAEPAGGNWSNAEMHAAMLLRRDSSDLDGEWRYHILCVKKIDSTPRGIMYDNGATDSNNVPREGIGISTHWIIPMTPDWGKVQGMRFGTAAAPYFRTGLHEIGHAMGLYHNVADMGVMNTTDVIAASAVLPMQFPDNIQWSHAPDDQKRLRHLPDIWVRPGGIPFGQSYASAPLSPGDERADAEGLALEVAPLLDSFPIGAPVRVTFRLTNVSSRTVPAPDTLHMGAGAVKGRVIDPAGTVRTFSPLVLCVEEAALTLLEPGAFLDHSLTLLRGGQGALFPTSGLYRVIVEVDFDVGGRPVGVTGETTLMVSGAKDDHHAAAARQILSTPDALLTLVLGGDHLTDGVAAVKAGLDDAVLRPHFAAVEARRFGKKFLRRGADFKKVAVLINRASVVTPREIQRIAEMAADAKGAPRAAIKKCLAWKVAGVAVPDAVRAAVRAI